MPRIRLFRRVNLLTALLLGVGGIMLGVLLTAAALRGRVASPPPAVAVSDSVPDTRPSPNAAKAVPTPAVSVPPPVETVSYNSREDRQDSGKSHNGRGGKKGRKRGGESDDDDD